MTAAAQEKPPEWARTAKICCLRRTDSSRKGRPLTSNQEQNAEAAEAKFGQTLAAALNPETNKADPFIQQYLAENTNK
ncbi:MAG: hypothetical protein ACOX6U_00020 [Oscillospiraceae bacterium]